MQLSVSKCAGLLVVLSAAVSTGQPSDGLSAVISIDAGEIAFSDFRFTAYSDTLKRDISTCRFRVENRTDGAWIDLFFKFNVVVASAAPGAADEVVQLRGKIGYIKHGGSVEGEIVGAYLMGRTPKRITAEFQGGQVLLTDEGREKLRLKDEQELKAAQQAEQKRRASQASLLRQKEKVERERVAKQEQIERDRLAKLPVLSPGGNSIAFLGADQRCAKQYQEALTMEGLEKRKRLADLVAFGCGFTLPAGTHVSAQPTADFVIATVEEGPSRGKSGWVPRRWLR